MIVPTFVPALLLGMTISTLLAAAVHTLRGRTWGELLRLWIVAQTGFWLAALGATLLHLSWWPVGELQWATGVVGGLLSLGAAIVTRK